MSSLIQRPGFADAAAAAGVVGGHEYYGLGPGQEWRARLIRRIAYYYSEVETLKYQATKVKIHLFNSTCVTCKAIHNPKPRF